MGQTVKNLLSFFITLFALPVSIFLALITFVAVSGIFTDFDWSFVVVTALCFIFFAVSYSTLVQPQQIWPELTNHLETWQ